jgi:hypothetical protein
MFKMPPRSWSTPTEQFALRVSRAKTTARGFWAWFPAVRLGMPLAPRRPQTVSPHAGAESYCEAIVAAARGATRHVAVL